MNLIHVGIKGTVLGIDRLSGKTVWQTKLKGSGFINVSLEGNDLIAATRGELWGLDPSTGAIRWQNGLPGMGYGLVTLASSADANVGALRAQMESDQQGASAAAGTGAH